MRFCKISFTGEINEESFSAHQISEKFHSNIMPTSNPFLPYILKVMMGTLKFIFYAFHL